MSSQPIGFFDSGIGGITIWKEVTTLLPNENTIYLADSKNAPYGEKPKEDILKLSIKNTEYLLNKGCKLIVVACNTATTNAIDYLRKHYKVPFIGIEPAIKPAALQTKTNSVGILATKGTLASSLFSKTSALYASNIKVTEQVGIGLVDLIEQGKLNSSEMTTLLHTYIAPMVAADIDYLVLGCTHYPFLIEQLRTMLPETVTIIDSGKAIAKQTQHILTANHIENTTNKIATHSIATNYKPEILQQFLGDDASLKASYLNF